jgi:glutamate--cysteine ligase
MAAQSKDLQFLDPVRLKGILRGVEKESLRVHPDGNLALTPHPAALGAALTHPHITTDFSESQLELITGTHGGAEALIEELTQVHQYVYRHIPGEILWCASMPCGLPADDAIPLGRYGKSNVGRAKTVYRMGLAYRYGRRMQAISGIHYNFSLPGVSSEQYFALIRNFRRRSWLLLYLFGASPAVCLSFVEGRRHELQQLSPGTLYMPHGTSLRMGRLGYQSDAQASLAVSYNSLKSYTASLYDALTQPYPPYEKIGVLVGNEYRQLAASLLQIENEFYGTIRPKRRIRRGERPLHALRERGVEYVEVRLMDLDPFEPVGIGAPATRLIDTFLLQCLLDASPPDTPEEIAALKRNQQLVATRGREPGLMLFKGNGLVSLSQWGKEILSTCDSIAESLDRALGGAAYQEALANARRCLDHPEAVPSARVLEAMAREHADTFTRFALAKSQAHADRLRSLALPAKAEMRLVHLAAESLAEQMRIEAADTVDFETFRRNYLSPELLKV